MNTFDIDGYPNLNIKYKINYGLYIYLDKLPSNYAKYSMKMNDYEQRSRLKYARDTYKFSYIVKNIPSYLMEVVFTYDNNESGYYNQNILKRRSNYDNMVGWTLNTPMRKRKIKLGQSYED